ncbi:MAG: hypothetical protein IPK68_02075 [Bdellovibrionales bacterium]|nr:hypothetical protein [Bdellovibrionales bacterium]
MNCQNPRRYLPFLILFSVFHFACLASSAGQSGCRNLIVSPGIDGQAVGELRLLHNLLAREYNGLEARHEEEDEAVAEFDSWVGLPEQGLSSASAAGRSGSGNSRIISVNLDSPEGPIGYGLRIDGDRSLEKSRRSEVLGRTGELYQLLKVKKGKGESRAQFAQVYVGKDQIRSFLVTMALDLNRHVKNSPSSGGLESRHYGTDQEGENAFGLDLGFFEIKSCRQGDRNLCSIRLFSDDPIVTFPVSEHLISPLGELFSIWVFPGELMLEIANDITHFQSLVNGGLSWLFTNAGLTWLLSSPVHLSVQESATVLVGGHVAVNALRYLVSQFRSDSVSAPRPSETDNSPKVTKISLEKKRAPIIPIAAQYKLMIAILADVAKGKRAIGPTDLIYWKSQYVYRPRGLNSSETESEEAHGPSI